jgi:hypothetical protein
MTDTDHFAPFSLPKFVCEKCAFVCCKKREWVRHILTQKHKNTYFTDPVSIESAPYHICIKTYKCFCGRKYKHKQSLFTHKKTCQIAIIMLKDKKKDDLISSDLVLQLVKQNNEIQLSMLDVIKNGTNNIITNNNTINQKFNLNFFLNEKCKDALNMSEFIDSLKVTLTDVENVGQMGFVNGISRILVNGLKELDVYKRPIHCSDVKRETMHVKENNVWEKGEETKPQLIQAIKKIADKNIKTIPDWKEENPDCRNGESKKSDQYLQIVGEATGGHTKETDCEKYEKIIKKIAKETTIERET